MRPFVAAAALVLTACSTGATVEFDAASQAAVRDSVTAAMRGYQAAVASLDSGQVMSFYSTDSSFRVVDGQAVFTRDGVGALLGALEGSLVSIGGGFNYDSLRVLPLAQTAAVATAPYVDVLVDTAGVTTTVHGSVMWVWVRQDGRWRIVGGQAAPSAPTVSQNR